MSIFGGILVTVASVLFGVPLDIILCLSIVMVCEFITFILMKLYNLIKNKKEFHLSSLWLIIFQNIAVICGLTLMHAADEYYGIHNMLREIFANMFIVGYALNTLKHISNMDLVVPSKIKKFFELMK